jgi:hypothetical protein
MGVPVESSLLCEAYRAVDDSPKLVFCFIVFGSADLFAVMIRLGL